MIWFTIYVIGAVVTTEAVGPVMMREVDRIMRASDHNVIAAAGTLSMLIWPIMVVAATVRWLSARL